MNILYEIPNGYRASEIKGHISANPSINQNAAIEQWVIGRFGPRITALISEHFTISNCSINSFEIDFPNDPDGSDFLRMFGGRMLEE